MPALIFALLLTITSAVTISAGVVGIKSGEIEKTIINPVRQQAENIHKSLTATPVPAFTPRPHATIVPSPSPSQKPSPMPAKKKIIRSSTPQPTAAANPTTSSNTSSFDSQKWFEEQQAKNQQWFAEQSAKNEQSAQQWYTEQTAKAAAEQEQWKKEHGF